MVIVLMNFLINSLMLFVGYVRDLDAVGGRRPEAETSTDLTALPSDPIPQDEVRVPGLGPVGSAPRELPGCHPARGGRREEEEPSERRTGVAAPCAHQAGLQGHGALQGEAAGLQQPGGGRVQGRRSAGDQAARRGGQTNARLAARGHARDLHHRDPALRRGAQVR